MAFDLDGTLLQEDKTIDPLTKASIQKAIADVITDTNMNHGIQKVIDALLMSKEMDLRQGTL